MQKCFLERRILDYSSLIDCIVLLSSSPGNLTFLWSSGSGPEEQIVQYWDSVLRNRVAEDWGDPSQTTPTTSSELSLRMVLTWMPDVVKYGISNLTLIGGCKRYQDQPRTKVRMRSIKYKIGLKSIKCMVRLKLSRKGWRLTLPSLSSPTTEGRPKWALIRYSCHWLQCH